MLSSLPVALEYFPAMQYVHLDIPAKKNFSHNLRFNDSDAAAEMFVHIQRRVST